MRREQRRYRPLIWFAIKLCPIYSFDDGRKGGEEASRIEDELSLSCHLVLRRNWNGVRSTITLAFARDRVSGVRKHIHTYVVRTRIHARIIAGFFPTRTDSGDCEVVACLESLAYIYIWKRDSMILISRRGYCYPLLPPSLRLARHSLVTSGLYSRKNIRGKIGERAKGRWNFDGKAMSYKLSSGNWHCILQNINN